MYDRAMPTIFLSAGIPSADRDPRYLSTANEARIREAVAAATRYALGQPGGVLRFGGQPGIVKTVVASAGRDPRPESIQLFLSSYFRSPDRAAVSDPYKPFGRHLTWVDPPVAHADSRDHALEGLRLTMLATPPDLALFVGGMEGVEAEFALCRRLYPDVPCVPLPTTGGAARILFDLWRLTAPADVVEAVAGRTDYEQLIPALRALYEGSKWRLTVDALPTSDPVFTELINLRESELLEELSDPTPGGQIERLIEAHPDHVAARVAASLRAELRAAPAAPVRAVRPRVLILPGLMGSTLGLRATGSRRDDVLWVDPVDILGGRFGELALDEKTPSLVSALELLPLVYTPLRLRLELSGFEVISHPFDWRRSLKDTGALLASVLREALGGDDSRPLHLVCHSMGCMLARAAIKMLKPGLRARLGKVVFLAPPNLGSVEALRALEGEHPMARMLRRLMRFTSGADQLIPTIQSFDGLYELLPEHVLRPRTSEGGGLPVQKIKSAREHRLGANPLFESVEKLGAKLIIVAGRGLRTTGFDKNHQRVDVDGDGVVPYEWTQADAAHAHYDVAWEHASMPGAPAVLAHMPALLNGECPMVLAAPAPPQAALRGDAPSRDVAAVDGDPYAIVGDFVRPPPDVSFRPDAAVPVAPAAQSTVEPSPDATHVSAGDAGLSVHRGASRNLSIRCVGGPLTAVASGAWVVPLHANAPLPRSLYELDRRLDHLVQGMLTDGSFSGRAGEQYLVPADAFPVPTRLILFVGLGPVGARSRCLEASLRGAFDQLRAWRVREAVVQLPETLDPASGAVAAAALRAASAAASPDRAALAVSLCLTSARDAARFHKELLEQLASALPRGTSVELLDPLVVVDPLGDLAATGGAAVTAPAYLHVDETVEQASGLLTFRYSVVGGRDQGAAVVTDSVSLQLRDLEALRRELRSGGITAPPMLQFGEKLALQILPAAVRDALRDERTPLVVVQGADTTRIPWEPIGLGGFRPAMQGGLSRQVRLDGARARRPPEHRRGEHLRVLAIIDPEGNLPSAASEGEHLEALVRRAPGLRIEFLRGERATLEAVCARLASGEFDVMHFAGHGAFDALNRARGGLRCANGALLNGATVAGLARTPPLLVFNACESGRVRASDDGVTLGEQMSLAEACMRAGVRGYVGTYWPVGDAAARAFAGAFYGRLVGGATISAALVSGRSAVESQPARPQDWADYMHYGDPYLTLRAPQAKAGERDDREGRAAYARATTKSAATAATAATEGDDGQKRAWPYRLSFLLGFAMEETAGLLTLAGGGEQPITFVDGVAEGTVRARPLSFRLVSPAPPASGPRSPNAVRGDVDPAPGDDEVRRVEVRELFARPGVAIPRDGRLVLAPEWPSACHDQRHEEPPADPAHPVDPQRFASWEHILCARFVGCAAVPAEGLDHLAVHFRDPVPVDYATKLPLGPRGERRFDFGEIICLAGDYYAHLDGESRALCADAWPTVRGRFADGDYREPTLSDEDPAVIEGVLRIVHSGAAGVRPKGEVWQLMATLATGYPVGRYLTLAAYNTCHFGSPHDGLPPAERLIANEALQLYERYHALALKRARDSRREELPFLRAVATDAFACHFLTDLFASGHMRTPRRPLGDRYGVLRGGLLMSMKMHDEDNEQGLWVRTRHAVESDRLVWRAYGDGSLLKDEATVHLRMVQTAVQRSVAEVFDAARGRVTAPGEVASLLVPIALEPEADPAKEGKPADGRQWRDVAELVKTPHNHRPLYRMTADRLLEKRRGGVESSRFKKIDRADDDLG